LELENFDKFEFHITEDKKIGLFECYNIPPHCWVKAGELGGFNQIQVIAQYPHPDYANHPSIVCMFNEVHFRDYTIKMKHKTLSQLT
jgi:hypothetical protein